MNMQLVTWGMGGSDDAVGDVDLTAPILISAVHTISPLNGHIWNKQRHIFNLKNMQLDRVVLIW